MYILLLYIYIYIIVPRGANAPNGGHRIHVRPCVHPSRIGVVLCVRDSAQTASHICTHLMPINCTIIVDVQHTFHFDLDLISDSGKGHKKPSFSAYLYKMGGTLCARLSPNCLFTYLHILGANQLYNHCRCATYLSF